MNSWLVILGPPHAHTHLSYHLYTHSHHLHAAGTHTTTHLPAYMLHTLTSIHTSACDSPVTPAHHQSSLTHLPTRVNFPTHPHLYLLSYSPTNHLICTVIHLYHISHIKLVILYIYSLSTSTILRLTHQTSIVINHRVYYYQHIYNYIISSLT